ncbi:hypothetical protein ETD86_46230 [Nonomuraea turkmeniaca]|uniref:DUF7144 domain-containing protein n=1 Tax=Nonomuraea turkmeniaca TaxID=103838 RepID=A0A5S4EYL2_9ACTN|nr:hypothetical protein [Nonomuraea turkmeniaca]TMR08805.1 hypothetical protein ETD86_46230 [Nonomuraea turkmeniaca]
MATPASPLGSAYHRGSGYSGWLGFAGTLVIVLGAFNIIEGFIALFKTYFFVTPSGRLLVWDYTAWGWIWLAIGALQLVIGLSILAGKAWARWTGVVLAGIAMIGHFAFLVAFPLWSVISIGLSALVMYGLIAPPKGAMGVPD